MQTNPVVGILLLIAAAPLAAERSTQDFQVRLLSPIASFSPAGTPFRGKILGMLEHSGQTALPAGSVVHGTVRRANSVGLGLRRERARLQIEFQGCELPTGEPVDCTTSLVAVDNARETVKKANHIEGILAAAHPHSWLQGVWYRPSSALLKRTPGGLTGAGGLAQSRLIPTPAGAAILIGSRLVLMRLPDPEITLPAGIDLILRISADNAATGEIPPAAARLSPELTQWLSALPVEIRRRNQAAVPDIVNLAFIGTKDGLIQAFEAAGWFAAETFNPKTIARTYAAISSMKTYPAAPVTPLYWQGRLPDLVFQKSFNSIAMRHHIRIWEVPTHEGSVWLGAATHDTAIALDWKQRAITHRIDTRIDRERSIVVNDLREAQCLNTLEMVARPELTADTMPPGISTDGNLAVGFLQECSAQAQTSPVLERPKRRVPARMAQRTILETRHYFSRGNLYYRGYQALRWACNSRRERNTAE